MTVHAFTDPVFDAQRVFRAAMNALARPGTLQPLDADLRPPQHLPKELAALAGLPTRNAGLLDAALAGSHEVLDYLRFHTGAPIVTRPGDASFALISDPALCPSLTSFTLGTPDYPDRSTTLLIQADTLRSSHTLTLKGPGISGSAALRAEPLPPGFVREWAANRALFPRGVDILIAAEGWLAGLPRSTEMNEA
ncbi:carbon-phosphorus lyase subunit PhnH [Terrihabitans soli]|uniref:Carbon-phosphorus lyase subunit PhnH n=1 Tax=Terrihabitans soli TaxID=708113 RepID=A0A6S6QTB4_9HYPH|nr:phosphonate C-P lyase system protein PhnH [Terrihabitans soli]BCJ89688.1 carbon-phosphorus lyase subunit PhnH [Terrihabitans soli]